MIFNIKHKTIFKYDNPPLSAIQKLRLTPRNDINQKILNWDIDIKGCSIELDTFDYHDNRIHLCKTKDDINEIEIIDFTKEKILTNNVKIIDREK